MTSEIERRSPVLVALKVDVPSERVQQSLDAAYGRLQRSARIRGFRPGKVPRHVVKQLLGKSVRQELAAELVEESLGVAFAEHGLQPIAIANVDAPPLVEGQALSFTAEVEVRPAIDAVDTTALEVYRTREPVSDEDVEREVTRMREASADVVTPDPPRPAQTGDLVAFDMRVELDGRERPEFAMRDSRTELGSHQLIEAIELALTGLDVGGTKTVDLPFSAEHENAELRGKTAHCTVEMRTIQTKLLPEVDDEFAKDLEHESLAALRQSIRLRLEASAEQRAAFRLREQVVERLVDRNPVAVPPTLIERQERAMMTEILQLQKMLGSPPGLSEEMHHGLHHRAERKVQAGLLLTALAQLEKVQVEDADLDRKFGELAERSGKHIAKVRAEHTDERLTGLRSQLLEDKLVELLLGRATVHDGEPPKNDAEADTSAEAADTERTESDTKKKEEKSTEKKQSPSKSETGDKPRPEGSRTKKGGT